MTDNDDIREALRAARDRQRAIPGDVVPQPAVTDEQLLRWHDMAGQLDDFTHPGESVPDADGLPAGVGPSTTDPIVVSDDWLTAEQKARLDHLLAERDIEETP